MIVKYFLHDLDGPSRLYSTENLLAHTKFRDQFLVFLHCSQFLPVFLFLYFIPYKISGTRVHYSFIHN